MKPYTNKTDRIDERKCLKSEIKKGDKAREKKLRGKRVRMKLKNN